MKVGALFNEKYQSILKHLPADDHIGFDDGKRRRYYIDISYYDATRHNTLILKCRAIKTRVMRVTSRIPHRPLLQRSPLFHDSLILLVSISLRRSAIIANLIFPL